MVGMEGRSKWLEKLKFSPVEINTRGFKNLIVSDLNDLKQNNYLSLFSYVK